MIDALIRGVFPPGVAVAWARLEDAPSELFAEEEACVARAVPKRRREFSHGRGCARRALAELGIAPGPLLVGAAREPVWPEGVVGSITHDRELSIAVAARSSEYAGIGVDVEPDEPLEPGVASRIWSAEEARAARTRAAVPLESAPKLVFAAKEAVYKCQFAVTRSYVGFQDVSVEFDAREVASAGTFTARFNASFGSLSSGFRCDGEWRRAHAKLLAAVWFAR
jgi:4'-phosphopantetheinyl transferase EntD